MSLRNSPQQDSVARRAGRWSTALAVVVTEAAQHYVSSGSTAETVIGHANTAAVWGLGFQLVAMAGTSLYRALPPNGEVTVKWRVDSRFDGEASVMEKDLDPGPMPKAPEARLKESATENEKHGV